MRHMINVHKQIDSPEFKRELKNMNKKITKMNALTPTLTPIPTLTPASAQAQTLSTAPTPTMAPAPVTTLA